jgi:hypothetical protein
MHELVKIVMSATERVKFIERPRRSGGPLDYSPARARARLRTQSE